jgi:hypothetical protein
MFLISNMLLIYSCFLSPMCCSSFFISKLKLKLFINPYSVEAQAQLFTMDSNLPQPQPQQPKSSSTQFKMDSNLEQRHSGESQSSKRFRSKMHAYDAHHQKLVEATYVREEARYAEWLKQRNKQRDLLRAVQGPPQNRDH